MFVRVVDRPQNEVQSGTLTVGLAAIVGAREKTFRSCWHKPNTPASGIARSDATTTTISSSLCAEKWTAIRTCIAAPVA